MQKAVDGKNNMSIYSALVGIIIFKGMTKGWYGLGLVLPQLLELLRTSGNPSTKLLPSSLVSFGYRETSNSWPSANH